MILGAEELNKFYGDEQVLENVNLSLEKGEVLGIVGESGCGKSTLARQLCCFEKPDSGKVLFKGNDTSKFKKNEKKEFRRTCQMILQDTMSSLDPTMTIGQSLDEALKYNSSLDEKERRNKIEETLEEVFLKPTCMKKRPMQLFGGERQRVNIARALLIEPEVLICDEITSSLDVITQYHIMRMLEILKENLGLAMIFISHDIKAVESMSDRILVMHDGKVCEELKRKEGFKFKDPYTTKLFESLPIDHPSKRVNLSYSFEDEIL